MNYWRLGGGFVFEVIHENDLLGWLRGKRGWVLWWRKYKLIDRSGLKDTKKILNALFHEHFLGRCIVNILDSEWVRNWKIKERRELQERFKH